MPTHRSDRAGGRAALEVFVGEWTEQVLDSRGIVRIYQMGLSEGVWTLLRDKPDFTPLEFAQRFEGTFSADGNTIDAQWRPHTTAVRTGSLTSI